MSGEPTNEKGTRAGVRMAVVAWLLTAIYYFYQYALRSAPGVMVPQLSDAFGLGPLGVASMVGLFYYGYSPFSLVAGAAMDRLGVRRLVPAAAVVVGIGALLFATGGREVASVGRFLQGAGGVFALIGAIYIATTNFPPSRAATQEDRIELPPILTLDIDEWLFVIARGQPGFDLPDPTAGRPMSVADIDHSDDSRSG